MQWARAHEFVWNSRISGPQIRNDPGTVRILIHLQPHQLSQGQPHVGVERAALALNEPALLNLVERVICNQSESRTEFTGNLRTG